MKKGTKFQHKKPDEAQVCAICGFPLKTYNALGKHVAKYHSNQCTMKEYVDKYVEPYAHKCPYCDNERNFAHGRYKETCADKACIQKHREATNMVKYGNKCSLKGTNEQKVVDAIVEKYGVDNVFKLDSMQQLAKQRIKDKYGKEYVSQVPEIRKKIEQVYMDKFGYKTNLLNPEHIERIKKTCLEKYGNEYVCASEYTQNKNRQHCLETFGVEYYMQTEDFRQKSKKTCLMKYGVEYSGCSPILQEKRRKTLFEHYGVIYPTQNYVLQERSRQTMLQRYGVEFAAQIPNKIKPHVYTKGADGYFSRSERIFGGKLDKLGIHYKFNWYFNKKHWDFAIYQNGIVDTVVEIDGEFHHGYNADVKCAKIDVGRFQMIGDGIKLICGDSKRIDDIVDSLLRTMNMTYSEWINDMKQSIPKEFPYPFYSHKRLLNDYNMLCREYTQEHIHKTAQYGMSTVYMYNKSMYQIPRKGSRSIVDAWQTEDLRNKCIDEHTLYHSECSSLNPFLGLSLSTVIPMPKLVSTGMYLYIIKLFLSNIEHIIEICPYNSALMLASAAANKTYQCIECISEVLLEHNEIAQLHKLPSVTNIDDNYVMANSCVIYDMSMLSLTISEVIQRYSSTRYIFISNNSLNIANQENMAIIRVNYGSITDIKYIYYINYKH